MTNALQREEINKLRRKLKDNHLQLGESNKENSLDISPSSSSSILSSDPSSCSYSRLLYVKVSDLRKNTIAAFVSNKILSKFDEAFKEA